MNDFDYGPNNMFNLSEEELYGKRKRPMLEDTMAGRLGMTSDELANNNKVEAQGAATKGAGGDAAGDAAGGAALAASNPWVKGGLAAMKVLSAGLERKRKEREMEYQSVVDKLNAQSKAVGNAQQFASRISY